MHWPPSSFEANQTSPSHGSVDGAASDAGQWLTCKSAYKCAPSVQHSQPQCSCLTRTAASFSYIAINFVRVSWSCSRNPSNLSRSFMARFNSFLSLWIPSRSSPSTRISSIYGAVMCLDCFAAEAPGSMSSLRFTYVGRWKAVGGGQHWVAPHYIRKFGRAATHDTYNGEYGTNWYCWSVA